MTKMHPVCKGSNHIEGESVEQAEWHLGIATTARPVLEGDDGAEEEEDDRQVGESLLGEAAQGGDDDPDVRAKEGEKNATMVS